MNTPNKPLFIRIKHRAHKTYFCGLGNVFAELKDCATKFPSIQAAHETIKNLEVASYLFIIDCAYK